MQGGTGRGLLLDASWGRELHGLLSGTVSPTFSFSLLPREGTRDGRRALAVHDSRRVGDYFASNRNADIILIICIYSEQIAPYRYLCHLLNLFRRALLHTDRPYISSSTWVQAAPACSGVVSPYAMIVRYANCGGHADGRALQAWAVTLPFPQCIRPRRGGR